MSALPYCCAEAAFDGFTPEEHARVCREPQPALDLPDQPKQGGQHP